MLEIGRMANSGTDAGHFLSKCPFTAAWSALLSSFVKRISNFEDVCKI